MTHNHFSFFWQQHNHPEYPCTNKTPDILLDINPGELSPKCASNEMTTPSITCNSLTPPCHSCNDVNAAIEDNCTVIRYALTKPQVPSKHLNDHNTFMLGETPRKDEIIIPVKLVLQAPKETASGKLENLKSCIVAQGNMEKQRIKKTRAKVQKQIQKQRQENAEN
jgi:hypothetical protein